jgi:exosortase/archaeosortase family protein
MSSNSVPLPALTRAAGTTPAPHRGVGRILRALVAVVIVTVCGVAGFANAFVRSVEASGAAHVLNLFIAGGSRASNSTYLVWVTQSRLVGFHVTAECTVLIILIPLLLLAATMIALTRVAWWRAALAIVATVLIVLAVNVARLAFIGWATQLWGVGFGYTVSHTFVGSVIGIAGFAGGLAVLVLTMGARPRTWSSRSRRARHSG